MQFEAKKTDPK